MPVNLIKNTKFHENLSGGIVEWKTDIERRNDITLPKVAFRDCFESVPEKDWLHEPSVETCIIFSPLGAPAQSRPWHSHAWDF